MARLAEVFPLLYYSRLLWGSNISTQIKAYFESVYRLKVNLTRIYGKLYHEIGVKLL